MSSKSTYLRTKDVNHNLGITAYTEPTGLWLAFGTAGAAGGAGFTEVTTTQVTNYTRYAISSPGTFFTASTGGGAAVNAAQFVTPTSSGGTGCTVTTFAIYDASTGGNILYSDAISPNATWNTSQFLQVAAGALSVQEL